MSNDDETVERVARALAAEASTTEMGNAGFNAIHRKEYVEVCWRDHEDRARAAISAIPPRELLREALSSLDALIEAHPNTFQNLRHGIGTKTPEGMMWLNARAAANKIRTAFREEQS